ncbi:ABC transporter substrate-binding protein [Fusobacterium gonidiaformans]|uniref:ABC transporter substrate-binding protein n=1 Tax=Fusobacterium gonidiaformans TaxID=849 RepID=UPI0023F54BEB|nr:helical backbone metal receptor [Fusobacterium gonidiaformans]
MKKIFITIVIAIFYNFAYAWNINKDFITDNYGNKIPKKAYSKIIVIDPGTVEILFEIGAENSIVAIGKTGQSKIYPIEKTEKLESVGNMTTPNFEKILQYKPDLVLVNSMMARSMQNFKRLNIPILVSDTETLQDIIQSIRVLGVMTAQEIKAETLAKQCEEKLQKIQAKIPKTSSRKGAILYAVSPMMAFGKKSLPGDILHYLGVENIADNVPGNRPILSPEYVLKTNPDFLAGAMSLQSVDDIINSSNVIAKTKAGKNKKIFILDSSMILRDSYRIFDEIEKLQQKIYE